MRPHGPHGTIGGLIALQEPEGRELVLVDGADGDGYYPGSPA